MVVGEHFEVKIDFNLVFPLEARYLDNWSSHEGLHKPDVMTSMRSKLSSLGILWSHLIPSVEVKNKDVSGSNDLITLDNDCSVFNELLGGMQVVLKLYFLNFLPLLSTNSAIVVNVLSCAAADQGNPDVDHGNGLLFYVLHGDKLILDAKVKSICRQLRHDVHEERSAGKDVHDFLQDGALVVNVLKFAGLVVRRVTLPDNIKELVVLHVELTLTQIVHEFPKLNLTLSPHEEVF